MTIDKAIEVLQAIIKTGDYSGEPDDAPALQLGIEALKAVKHIRRDGFWSADGSLLGETQ